MVSYNCYLCNFKTPNKYNYNQHIKSKKHLNKLSKNGSENVEKCGKNVENVEKKCIINTEDNQKSQLLTDPISKHVCNLCSKVFSRNDSLKRHISVCKLNQYSKIFQNIPMNPKNVEKKCIKTDFECQFCGSFYSTQFNLNKHIKKCASKQNEISNLKYTYETKLIEAKYQGQLETKQAIIEEQQKTIETVKQMKPTVTHITNNNSTNKTINYLNTQYGEMIAMEKFLHNLQYEEQLTTEECRKLLASYKDSGIELFARSFSHVMKENCRRQLLKQGLPEMDIIPLYCSDGNFRSHKEKNSKGWKTKYDNQSLNTMINISSEQVYENCQKPLMIFGKERNKVFKQLKQDNHSQKITDKKMIENN